MKFFNWEKKSKPNIKESLDRENLSTKDHSIIKQELDVENEQQRLQKNDPNKSFVSAEELPDDMDWEELLSNQIDQKNNEEKELDETTPPRTIHYPQEVKEIIQKHSLPNEEWKKLSQQERRQIVKQTQEEIKNLYQLKPKKYHRKKSEIDPPSQPEASEEKIEKEIEEAA